MSPFALNLLSVCPWRSWSLGEADAHLSYYNGLIQLTYSNGSQYNNEQHTLRSTLISFLCNPEAGIGQPEFQVTCFILCTQRRATRQTPHANLFFGFFKIFFR